MNMEHVGIALEIMGKGMAEFCGHYHYHGRGNGIGPYYEGP